MRETPKHEIPKHDDMTNTADGDIMERKQENY